MNFRWIMPKLVVAFFVLFQAFSVANAQTFGPRSGLSQSQPSTTRAKQQNRSLELRVLVDDRSRLGASHEWMQALSDVGADRVVAETSRVQKPSFEEYGSGSSKTLAVIGIVRKGILHLPGGKFSIRQTSSIRNHLQKLRDDGAEVTIAEKVAFGLTAKQLVSVHDQLSSTIQTSTKGKNAGKLAIELLRASGYSTKLDQGTKLTISRAESTVDAELEGFSIGMGLSLTLRQIGLVFEPTRPQGQEIQILIRQPDQKAKHWPVGWPLSDTRKKAAPNLFVKVPVEAFDTPIMDLLNAIEGKIKLPFVYDTASISRNEIDLAATKVTYSRPGKKSSFDAVIDKVLNQVKPKLKSELKIDEVGKPFLWITTR